MTDVVEHIRFSLFSYQSQQVEIIFYEFHFRLSNVDLIWHVPQLCSNILAVYLSTFRYGLDFEQGFVYQRVQIHYQV